MQVLTWGALWRRLFLDPTQGGVLDEAPEGRLCWEKGCAQTKEGRFEVSGMIWKSCIALQPPNIFLSIFQFSFLSSLFFLVFLFYSFPLFFSSPSCLPFLYDWNPMFFLFH